MRFFDDLASRDAFINQAGAELAFAKSMGWDDWTFDEESDEGMVRGYRVQWSPDPNAGIVVYDEDDDDARYVLVTGKMPTFTVRGWTTVGEAKRLGKRIGQG
jgi:hypothetical protein